jgi:hypothetical protein
LPLPELKVLPLLFPGLDPGLALVPWLWLALPPELGLWLPLLTPELCVDPPLEPWLLPELKLWPLLDLKL